MRVHMRATSFMLWDTMMVVAPRSWMSFTSLLWVFSIIGRMIGPCRRKGTPFL